MAASYVEDLVETGAREETGEVATLITALPTYLIHLGSNVGYPTIFALTLLDSAGVPFPSEIILPFAGYLVFHGTLQYWPVIFYATIAALLGSSVDYCIGKKLGRSLITGQARLPYVPAAQLQKLQRWFDVHGSVAVALLRLVPGARVLISFPAGACKMKPIVYEAYTLLGCFTWNVTLVYLGLWLGSSWGIVTSFFRYLSILVVFIMIVFALWILPRRRNT
jgi:membrane protein DedA with SNARE-associated domain